MDTASIKKLLLTLPFITLAGCATLPTDMKFEDALVTTPKFYSKKYEPKPVGKPIVVAVYRFNDQTGQRKAVPNVATLSSAITQGADNYLIRSLQTVGEGKWFKVIERSNLDHLIKERQIIRQMRELYEGKNAKPLPPMLFAGILFEGGIIGYDSNVKTGGAGARIMGIGGTQQYSRDEITVSLRAVSVLSGEILASVTVTKSVLSYMDKVGVVRFFDEGTKSLEAEVGNAQNESMNKAVQLGVHAAVLEMIFEGQRKGHWKFSKGK